MYPPVMRPVEQPLGHAYQRQLLGRRIWSEAKVGLRFDDTHHVPYGFGVHVEYGATAQGEETQPRIPTSCGDCHFYDIVHRIPLRDVDAERLVEAVGIIAI